ncbi:hypothetical protein N0V82_009950 [Gnomoniopsis sp. IMI 355080]|nr:hypothetical protein N0V82_009950 [Gnomoniopsis sp. IMI 355080]
MAIRRLSRYITIAILFVTTLFLLRDRNPFLNPLPSSSSSYHGPPLKYKPSSFDWSNAKQYFPVSSHTPLPTGQPKTIPKVQYAFPKGKAAASSSESNNKVTQLRQNAVRRVFQRAWNAYKQQAWLWDELRPVSGGGKNTFGGYAATLVDALDTLWIMGLHDDFHAAAAAAVQLDFANTTDTSVNLFETTIRHLGGLLAAYDLSREPALLAKAKELGDLLFMAFDTPNRMPGFWLDFANARSGNQQAGTHDPSASPASLSLEFTRLAQLTGENKYYDAIERVRVFLARTQHETKLPGMWPVALDFRNEQVGDSSFTLGALADSLYEYLPKMFLLTGGLQKDYERMYRDAMDVALKHLLFRPMLPGNDDILFSGNAHVHEDGVTTVPEGQHLSCFVGGMFLLGGRTFGIPEHVGIGERVARGCAWAYDAMPTGLMPEIFDMVACPTIDGCAWDEERWKAEGSTKLAKGFKNARDARYILRPEAIESVFLLYRVTGNEELRDVAWRMFESIMKATETAFANSAIADVTVTGTTKKLDSMESFWLAETLKYFYLIFSDPNDVINLDEWVFNTEAHPLRRPKS